MTLSVLAGIETARERYALKKGDGNMRQEIEATERDALLVEDAALIRM